MKENFAILIPRVDGKNLCCMAMSELQKNLNNVNELNF